MVALLISKMQPKLLKKCNQTINPLLGTGFMVAFFQNKKCNQKCNHYNITFKKVQPTLYYSKKCNQKVQPNDKSITRYWIHGCIFSKQKVQPKVQPLFFAIKTHKFYRFMYAMYANFRYSGCTFFAKSQKSRKMSFCVSF